MSNLKILLLSAVALTGCKTPVDPNTGVAAEVRRGPLSPVEQPGVDNTAPVEGATVVVFSGSKEFGTANTDANGKASIPVPGGDYDVNVTTCPGAVGPPAPQLVTVFNNSFTLVQLVCDTGIR